MSTRKIIVAVKGSLGEASSNLLPRHREPRSGRCIEETHHEIASSALPVRNDGVSFEIS